MQRSEFNTVATHKGERFLERAIQRDLLRTVRKHARMKEDRALFSPLDIIIP